MKGVVEEATLRLVEATQDVIHASIRTSRRGGECW